MNCTKDSVNHLTKLFIRHIYLDAKKKINKQILFCRNISLNRNKKDRTILSKVMKQFSKSSYIRCPDSTNFYLEKGSRSMATPQKLQERFRMCSQAWNRLTFPNRRVKCHDILPDQRLPSVSNILDVRTRLSQITIVYANRR